ncbi:hypothetical protein EPUL_003303 [Erysiphe pulchra]|uniref:Uncharacterized protein n=1 Tax=Erysiphe pulchra TaxID=225359 RepID=A0A2S4PLY2_9PEZI|nr:hypothetical protein EPUL_003303 [Erysiphe pulchra]
MAPPLASKRALPPDPPDAWNCVQKLTTSIGKASRTSFAKARPSLYTADSSRRGITREIAQNEAQESTDPSLELYVNMTEFEDDRFNDEISTKDSHRHKALQASEQSPAVNSEKDLSVASQNHAVTLMDGIKGLLDLTNDYLRMLEEKHPGVEADFLALLADGASRAMRSERIYISTENKSKSQQPLRQDTWANKAKIDTDGTKVFNVKRQITKSNPPKDQSREDRRVMIRLAPDYEARKTGAFELRQKVQQLVSDKSLVSDVWPVPSGIAILAPTVTG